VRDAWEEVAAVVCALWSLCAVPVVIVDTVAMPGEGEGFLVFWLGNNQLRVDVDEERSIRTGQRCRGSRLSSQSCV
jgi:hypothetical protein